LPDVEFNYEVISPLPIVNNGHTVRVNVPAGSSITLDGKEYLLEQFHFHAPSEHTIDGKHYAMELHFVHETADGEAAAVGVLIEEGDDNPAFQPFFDAMPKTAGPQQEVEGSIDPNAFLPVIKTTYRYEGSLTTPPCVEGVEWLLMTEPVSVSPEQVEAFRSIYDMNARPIQPINGREVDEDTTA
jgi:carbonic anhydrase